MGDVKEPVNFTCPHCGEFFEVVRDLSRTTSDFDVFSDDIICPKCKVDVATDFIISRSEPCSTSPPKSIYDS